MFKQYLNFSTNNFSIYVPLSPVHTYEYDSLSCDVIWISINFINFLKSDEKTILILDTFWKNNILDISFNVIFWFWEKFAVVVAKLLNTENVSQYLSFSLEWWKISLQ